MKNKKVLIGIMSAVLILIAIVTTIIIINQKGEKAEDILSSFIALINEQKYEEMYNLVSESTKSEISQEDFVKRNKNIYEGIDAVNINIYIIDVTKEKKVTKITYSENMSTSAGDIKFSNTAKLVKENKEYKIEWSSNMIFPELRNTDKVRISTLEAKRGEILDRNDEKLAANGTISNVGIVPGKLGENKEENISKISELTGVSIDYINTQISASYVKDDTFVPIKKVASNDTELKEKLLQISGVKITSIDGRVYPLGEEAAHLIGYIQPINADELK